jgi:hypothetical protein
VRRRYLAAGVVAIVAIGVAVAAATWRVDSGGPVRPEDPDASSPALAVDATACPLPPVPPPPSPTAEPSPAEPSPSRPAFDDDGSILLAESTAGDPDDGTGRLRLCVDGLDPIDIPVACAWSVDRSSVKRIGGGVVRPGGGQASVGMELPGGQIGEIGVEITATPESVGQYRSIGTARVGIEPAPGATAAVVRFTDLPFVVGQAGNPPVPADQPATISGTMRWSCDTAPAPLPGIALGRLTIRLDRPVGRQVDVGATCQWSSTPTGPVVAAVAMTSTPVDAGAGRTWSAGIDSLDAPTTPGIWIFLSTPDGGDNYGPDTFGAVIVADRTPANREGRIRFHGLVLSPDTGLQTLDGTEGTRRLSGMLTWACNPPLAPPGAIPPGAPVVFPPDTRPGIVTIGLGGVLDAPVEVPVTCVVFDSGDGGGTQLDHAEGRFAIGEESVMLMIADGSAVLFRTAPDGRVLGEYSAASGAGPVIGPIGDVPGSQALTLHFGPIDPLYAPFGGEAGLLDVGATLVVDCRDPNAAPSVIP